MLDLRLLRGLLEDQKNIIVDLHISLTNMKRLSQDIYESESEIKRHGFFQHHWYQLRFISIVQLVKLISPSDSHKRSFYKLFNMLMKSPYDDEMTMLLKTNEGNYFNALSAHSEVPLTNNLSEDISYEFGIWIQTMKERNKREIMFKSRGEIKAEIDELMARLQSPLVSDAFRKVLIYRDKIYAHKDPTSTNEVINLDEIELLVNEAGEIFSRIYMKFFGTTILFGFTKDWSIEYVIQRLYVLKKKVEEELDRLKNERDT